MTEHSREALIEICKKAIVPEDLWHNRDSHEAHKQLGEALALLEAGCEYKVLDEKNNEDLITNEDTIWIEIASKGFGYFEDFDSECDLDDEYDYKQKETYYLPTVMRLGKKPGEKDWY